MIDYTSTAVKKISTIIFGLASVVLSARYLGPDGRGQFAVIVGFSAILFSILNFGVSNFYPRERRLVGQSLAASYTRYFFALFGVILLAGTLWTAVSRDANPYAIGTILAAFSLLRMQTQSVLLVEDLRGATRATIMGAACEAFLLLICYLLFDRYVVLAVGALVAKELVILGASALRLRSFPGERRTIWPIGASLAADGNLKHVFLTFALSALITINYKVDAVIMSFIGLPESRIGIYAIGVAIAEYLWILSDIFKDVQVSRTARGAAAEGVARAVRLAVTLTLMAYVAFAAVGWFIVPLIFGSAFEASYVVTLTMLGATIFMVPCKIIGVYYIAIGRIGIYARIMSLCVIINVGLNFMLIPSFGIYGAVIASVASYVLAGGWIMVDFSRFEAVSVRQLVLARRDDVTRIFKPILDRVRNRRTKAR